MPAAPLGLPLPPLARGLALAAGLGLAVGGCGGTPFGDQLARSFSNAPPPAQAPAAPGARSETPAVASGSGAAANPPPPGASPEAAAPTAAAPAAEARPAASTARALLPAPYRVTIKLPAADPSAPAEVVTQALRAAGVSFEVEMIERVPGTAATAKPATAAAPPTATPAPPPR
jgi:hypothetical protein